MTDMDNESTPGRQHSRLLPFVFSLRRDWLVTPLILGLNILLFLAMVLSSGTLHNILLPDNDLILRWGADIRILTLGDRQYWRILASMFEHFGIIHLAVNMYALVNVALFLEPLLGRVRYAVAYLCCGVFASLNSLVWHENSLSAGASGAIFGLYGLFFALLTTNLLPREHRRPLFSSIGIMILFNLGFGSVSFVDNAAHIGGLVSGFAMGYAYYFSLRAGARDRPWPVCSAILALTLLAFFLLTAWIKDPFGAYKKAEAKFLEDQKMAIRGMDLAKSTDDPVLLEKELRTVSLPAWDRCALDLKTMDTSGMAPALLRRRDLSRQYVTLQTAICRRWREALGGKTEGAGQEILAWRQQIDSLLREIKKSQ
jgi:rhomboid protease GluP